MREVDPVDDLLRHASAGADAALTELYGRYARAVYRTAWNLTRSSADAEDVVQDVFLGLPRALRSYRGDGEFGGWLHRVAVRTTLMQMRANRRRREDPLDPGVAPSGGGDAAGAVDRIALERAMRGLAEPLRTVFVLKVVEGYAHREVAELLGITVAASKVRLHRARQALQNLLRS